MTAVLVGASPYGSQALLRLGIPYALVVEAGEDPSRVAGHPVAVVTAPYVTDPTSVVHAVAALGISSLEGVFSFTEDGLLPAALAAEAFGAPTVSGAAVVRTRHKLTMRRVLAGAVPQPKFGVLAPDGIESLPYPVIIKPVDGSGSERVRRVASSDEAVAAIRESPDRMMWEEYLDGPEFSIETVILNGKHTVLGVTEKWVEQPHFIEVQHLAQAGSPARYAPIAETVVRALNTLGITCGAAHTEAKLLAGQVFIIETHTRPGGDRIPVITELVTGLDQYELAVRSMLGLPFPEPSSPKHPFAATTFFQWPEGEVAAIDGVDDCRNLPGVEEIVLRVAPGERVRDRVDNMRRPGWAVVGGQSREEVLALADEVHRRITVRYAETSPAHSPSKRARP